MPLDGIGAILTLANLLLGFLLSAAPLLVLVALVVRHFKQIKKRREETQNERDIPNR